MPVVDGRLNHIFFQQAHPSFFRLILLQTAFFSGKIISVLLIAFNFPCDPEFALVGTFEGIFLLELFGFSF